jgi:hypothetical protein
MEVLKRLETMSDVELVALDDTVLRCLRGVGTGDYARAVYQSLKADLETGLAQMPVYSRKLLLWALKREFSTGRYAKVYVNILLATTNPDIHLTLADCRGN